MWTEDAFLFVTFLTVGVSSMMVLVLARDLYDRRMRELDAAQEQFARLFDAVRAFYADPEVPFLLKGMAQIFVDLICTKEPAVRLVSGFAVNRGKNVARPPEQIVVVLDAMLHDLKSNKPEVLAKFAELVSIGSTAVALRWPEAGPAALEWATSFRLPWFVPTSAEQVVAAAPKEKVRELAAAA